MTDSALAIRCSGLVKRYAGKRGSAEVQAVNGLDLEVRRGECFGLLGPNGAGKTTTVEILEGLLDPTEGDVEILGRRWAADEMDLRERLGVSLQQTHLPDRVKVKEVVQLFRSFYKKGRDPLETLDLVSLRDKGEAWYESLSGGQQQRLAVACALVGDPELLFLDEPTTGLDPQSRRQLWDVVIDFKKRGGTVLLTTHYMDEAEKLCDRVAVVDHGKIIALGTPSQLIESLGGREVVELAVEPEAPADLTDALSKLPGAHHARTSAAGLSLAVEQLHVTLPALLGLLESRGLQPSRLSTHRATLEDVFVSLTGRALRE